MFWLHAVLRGVPCELSGIATITLIFKALSLLSLIRTSHECRSAFEPVHEKLFWAERCSPEMPFLEMLRPLSCLVCWSWQSSTAPPEFSMSVSPMAAKHTPSASLTGANVTTALSPPAAHHKLMQQLHSDSKPVVATPVLLLSSKLSAVMRPQNQWDTEHINLVASLLLQGQLLQAWAHSRAGWRVLKRQRQGEVGIQCDRKRGKGGGGGCNGDGAFRCTWLKSFSCKAVSWAQKTEGDTGERG